MFLPSSSPFMMMATSDYYPIPMHTARNSAPLGRRSNPRPMSCTATLNNHEPKSSPRPYPLSLPSTDPAPQPKQVQRVDSGFDGASERSSITLTEEVERRRTLQLYLHQYHDFEDASEDEEKYEDEGNLGLKHTDSLCLIAERAINWEDKAVRVIRNRKSKLNMVKKWFKRTFIPGSDGSSWHMTL